MGNLNVAKIRSLTAPGRYGDGETLFLHVAPGGSKSWVQRITVNGRRRDIGLGAWPLVSLADAREKAIDNRRLARSGGDPMAAKRRAAMPTFREATARTVEALAPTWRNPKHTASWSQTLEKHAFPVLAAMRVDQIERQDVLRVLKPLWNRKSETGRRVRQRIRMVLSWCQAQGFVDVNMAGEVISGALPPMRTTQRHMTALPYAEMTQVLRTIEGGIFSTNAKLCLRFTVLTATRGKEARGARWEEVDLEDRLWCIPAQRTKTFTEHRQPLSRAALAVLERARTIADGSGLVFPSSQTRGGPFSNVAMMLVVKRNGLGGRMTMHGCRATFRTWASECTDAHHAVMEMSLGHAVGSSVERVYARSDLLDKRRALMEQWGSYVAPALDESSETPAGDVVPERAPDKPSRRTRAGFVAMSSQSVSLLAEHDAPEPVVVRSRRKRRAEPSAYSSQRLQLALFGDLPTD